MGSDRGDRGFRCGAAGLGARVPAQGIDLVREPGGIGRIEAPARRGRADRTQAYFELWPIVRPKEISPLSIRMLKPHSGLVQTHAL